MMKKILDMKDLSKSYWMGKDEFEVLHHVDLQVEEGEFISILGPSGSGKTTLMNIIGCLDTPTSGNYILNGTEVSSMTDNKLAEIRNKEIGFVFQVFNLLPRNSALENVMLPLIYAGEKKQTRRELALKMLEDVGLGDRVEHKPNELSGGQRQRVAIARALVNKPSLLLADEPTGNLDSKISEEIMKLFADIHRQGNTLLMVTHEEDIARHAHRIIKLKDGEVESDVVNPNPIY